MPTIPVKKVVAVCFLEATKLTLEHLGNHRLVLSQSGVTGSPELPRFYGETRRLRDYLQRCATGYQDLVDLDLTTSDQALLVACCRRAIDAIDLRIEGDQIVPVDERVWLQKKRQVLADWAVAIAEKPLLDLPIPRLSPTVSEAARALMVKLQHKLFGDVNQRKKILAPNSGPVGQAVGLPSAADDFAPPPPLPPEDKAVVQERAPGRQPAAAPEAPRKSGEGAAKDLLDSRQLRDPRLRNLAAMDLRSYDRSVQAQDYRLAAVMLAAVLEAAVLDHAIPRRSELGLTGGPETWNTQDVLVKVMGDTFSPKDRSLAYHLHAARNLLRPALQITTPTVVTQASLQRLQEFVERALHSMGFTSNQPAAAAPEDPPMLRPSTSMGTNIQPPSVG